MNCKHIQELLKLMAEHELTFEGFVDARPELRCGICRPVSIFQPIEVKVTQEDIERARVLTSSEFGRDRYCPTALAAKRTLGEVEISCGAVELRVTSCSPEISYQLPPAAMKFIKDFDSGKPVEPITFWLKRS